MTRWIVAAVAVVACMAFRAHAAGPRVMLRETLDNAPPDWVKIHAAVALITAGDFRAVRDELAADGKIPDGAPRGYRIGVWRSLAGAAATAADRAAWVTRIHDVAADPAADERLFAIESLSKLGVRLDKAERDQLLQTAKSAKLDDAPMMWWLLAVSGEPTAKAELVKSLASPSPIARMRAAYALRKLGALAVHEWGRIAEPAYAHDADPLADAYLSSSAYVTAPSLDSASRYKVRVIELARNGTPKQQYEAANALGERGGAEDSSLLREMLGSSDSDVRVAAAGALLMIEARGGKSVSPTTRPTRPLTPADGVVFEQDVPFLPPGRCDKLDLYLPAKRKPGERLPAIVMIHGGGWLGGDKAGGREYSVGITLAQAGYVYASINYQLDPSDRWPRNLLDCKNAVRFLRANADKYGIDPDYIGVIGSSAGGHLALMVAYTSGVADLEPTSPYPYIASSVSAVVNLFGVTDIASWKKTDEKGEAIESVPMPFPLFSASGGNTTNNMRDASPVTYVSATTVPTLTIHGTADNNVYRGQATTLEAKLKEAGVEHETILLDGVGHSFNLTQTFDKKPLSRDLRPVVIGFFDNHLKALAK
jgi:acetyl esterase/lipase